MMDGRSVPERMNVFADNGNGGRCGSIWTKRARDSRKTDWAGGALNRLFQARGTWVLSQLQNIDCRNSRRGGIEVGPPGLFEDLFLFQTETRFDERNELKATLQEGESDLLQRPPTCLHFGARACKRSLPVTGCFGLRMHVGEKDSCAGAGHSINLARKGLEVVDVTNDEAGKHQVGGAIFERQRSAATQAK